MPTTLPAPNLDEDTVRYILYLGEKGRPTVEPTLYTCPGTTLFRTTHTTHDTHTHTHTHDHTHTHTTHTHTHTRHTHARAHTRTHKTHCSRSFVCS
jgi:hypothetical protein